MLMFEIRARTLGRTRMRDGLVDKLRTKVKKVLSDPSYAQNAAKISKKMSQYGGSTEAASLIEKLTK